MKSKQKCESCTLDFPITIDFMDLDTVEEVVEEAFVKDPEKKRRKA